VLLARVNWLPDSTAIAAQRVNRVQNRLDLLLADAKTGESSLLLQETDPTWVNVSNDLHFFRDGKRFLWSSERSGFRHLYLYSREGKLLKQLTKGEWEVTQVSGVDEKNGFVYFISTEKSPLERQLYRVKLDGKDRQPLTKTAGSHNISLSPGCKYYTDSHSNMSQPSRRTLHTAEGKELAVLEEANRKPYEDYELLPSEILTVKAADGATLYAKLTRPAGFSRDKKYPVIVMVYGGPHSQTVRDAWSGLTLEQALAHKGFVIWQLDNRGSSGRGHSWESKLYRRLGKQELEDQKAGVAHLISMGFADPARVGIYGWSYGGYMTLYSLLNAPEVFRAGVAGAPVTDWRNYDTIYTERYLSTPQENAEGYRLSSPVNQAENLKGKLLIVHNFEDDNVLFQNSMQMTAALEKAGKMFELMVYPGKSHGVTGPSRKHLNAVIADFFERSLAGK
jgi:dipeptidyl-peptidase-4